MYIYHDGLTGKEETITETDECEIEDLAEVE